MWLGVIFGNAGQNNAGLLQCPVCYFPGTSQSNRGEKKNRVLMWETRFEPGTSREGSKYANCPTAAFHVFTSIYYFISASRYDAFSTTYVT